MKVKILSVLLVFWLCTPSIFAGDHLKPLWYAPVQNYDFNLQVSRDWWRLTFEWNTFEKDEKIKWWKLVYSQKTGDISYPENTARYLWKSQDLDEATQWFDAGKYYFRLCAITQKKNRYCSDALKYEFSEKTHKKERSYETSEKKDTWQKAENRYYVWNSKKCEVIKFRCKEWWKYFSDRKGCGCKKYTWGHHLSKLDEKIKKKIDMLLENFLKKLDAKGYSNTEMISKIDIVIHRLKKLKNKKRYATIVRYMISVLETKKWEYGDTLDEIEKVFEGL